MIRGQAKGKEMAQSQPTEPPGGDPECEAFWDDATNEVVWYNKAKVVIARQPAIFFDEAAPEVIWNEAEGERGDRFATQK